MLTGDVSETGGFRLFRSRDFGLTFDPVDLPFEPLIQMLYNPGDCNIILTLSVMVPALSSASDLIYFRIDLICHNLVIVSNPDTVQTGYIPLLNSHFIILLALSIPSSWTSGCLKTLAPPGGRFMTVFVWSDGEKRLSLKFVLVCFLDLKKRILCSEN